jgi:hypothetical protein
VYNTALHNVSVVADTVLWEVVNDFYVKVGDTFFLGMGLFWVRSKNCQKQLLASSWPPVCPHGTTQLPLDGFSWNLIFEDFSKICRENSSFMLNRTRLQCILREDQFTSSIISRSFRLRMKNISCKPCRENRNTHFTLNNFFFENCALCEICGKNNVERGRPQMTIWPMRIACWIPKAKIHTHSLCNTHCVSLQQWLQAPQCYVIRTLPVLLTDDEKPFLR